MQQMCIFSLQIFGNKIILQGSSRR